MQITESTYTFWIRIFMNRLAIYTFLQIVQVNQMYIRVGEQWDSWPFFISSAAPRQDMCIIQSIGQIAHISAAYWVLCFLGSAYDSPQTQEGSLNFWLSLCTFMMRSSWDHHPANLLCVATSSFLHLGTEVDTRDGILIKSSKKFLHTLNLHGEKENCVLV